MSRGMAGVLVGKTISVTGVAFDLFVRLYGDRPSMIVFFSTDETHKIAELAKLAFREKFGDQSPKIEIVDLPVSDFNNHEDFLKAFCKIGKILKELRLSLGGVKERSYPALFLVSGGRKAMAIAFFLAASTLGFDVYDARSSTADEDRAYNKRIEDEFREASSPKEVFRKLKPLVMQTVFRPADIYYRLPRVRIDEVSDGRLIECLK